MKRIISFVLAFAVLLSLSVTASASNYNDFLNIKDESQYDMEAYYQELWINYEANTSYLWNYICGDQCNSYVQIANHFEGNGWYEFATRWTEQELTKERYVEILVNLMSLMDYTTHDMIEKQVNADTLKTFGDYALDVSEILVETVTLHSAFGSRVTEPMKKIATAMGLTSGAAELTVDTIEAYKYLDWTLQTYEHYDSFLTAIIQNADDELLRDAAIELSDIVNKTFYCKINAVSDISESTAEYIGKDVFFDTIVLDKMLANASILDLSESDFAILDLLKNTYSVFKTSLSYIQDWSVFISDMLGGSSDVMNRYNEMRALTAIRETLIKQVELYRNNIKDAHNYVEIGKLCVLMKDLVCINYRGEYCVYEMLVHDGQAFSLVVKWNGEAMTYDEIFERTKLYTAAYIDAIDSIFPDPERYHLEETTAPPNEYSSFTDVIENTKSRIEYGSFSENQKEFCRGDFFEIDGRNALVLMYYALNGSDLTPGYYVGLWVEDSDGTISCLTDQLIEEVGNPDDAYVTVSIRKIEGKMYLNPYVRTTNNNTDISKNQYYLIGDNLVLEYNLYSEAPYISMGDGLIQQDESKSVYYLNQEQVDRSTFYSTQDKLNVRTYVLGINPNWSEGRPPEGYTFEELLAQLPVGTTSNDSDMDNSLTTELELSEDAAQAIVDVYVPFCQSLSDTYTSSDGSVANLHFCSVVELTPDIPNLVVRYLNPYAGSPVEFYEAWLIYGIENGDVVEQFCYENYSPTRKEIELIYAGKSGYLLREIQTIAGAIENPTTILYPEDTTAEITYNDYWTIMWPDEENILRVWNTQEDYVDISLTESMNQITNAGKNDLSQYIATDVKNFSNMFIDLVVDKYSDGTQMYSNSYLFFDEDHNDKVYSISLNGESDFTICGLYYGMPFNEAYGVLTKSNFTTREDREGYLMVEGDGFLLSISAFYREGETLKIGDHVSSVTIMYR